MIEGGMEWTTKKKQMETRKESDGEEGKLIGARSVARYGMDRHCERRSVHDKGMEGLVLGPL